MLGLLTIIPPAYDRRDGDAAVEDTQRTGEGESGEEASVRPAPHGHSTRVYEVEGIAEVPGDRR